MTISLNYPVCSDAITNQWKKRLNVHWKKRHIYDVICPLYIESLLIFLFKIDIKANKLTLIFKFKIQELHQYIYIRCNVFSEIRNNAGNFFWIYFFSF